MATCSTAAPRLRRWLRDAWLSRVSLIGWCRGLGEWLRGSEERKRERRPPFRPEMEPLEGRETPDDLLGLLQVPLVLGGVPLIAGTLPTPGSAFLRGWGDGRIAARPEPPPAGLAAVPPADGLSAAELANLLSAWQPSPVQTPSGGAGAVGAGTEAVSPLDAPRPALPVGATGMEPLRLSGVPRTAEDLLRNPLGDDWLSSVDSALEAARQRRVAPPDPIDHSNGGGGSGDSGLGSAAPGQGGGGGGGGAEAHPQLPPLSALASLAGAAPASANSGTVSGAAVAAPAANSQSAVPLVPPPSGPPGGGGGLGYIYGVGGVSATEGMTFTAKLAQGGADPTVVSSVSVDWGDGTSSPGTIQWVHVYGGSYTYTVYGTHVYKDEMSGTITVTVGGPGGSVSATDGVTVADALLSGGAGFVANPVEGTPFGGAVVYFTDDNVLYSSASDFTATVDWGDGSGAVPATVTGSGGGLFQVSVPAGHVYQDENTYTLTVNVTDDGGSAVSFTGTVNVQDARLKATGNDLGVAEQGHPLSNVLLANLTDANPLSTTADYTVSPGYVQVNWGDGTGGNVTVSGGGGSFTIQGTHTYNAPGPYTIVIVAHDDGGNTAVTQSTVTVLPLPFIPNDLTTPAGSASGTLDGQTLVPVGEAEVGVATGALRLRHPLDFDLSPGTSVGRGPALVYNSDTVSVRPILPFTLRTDPNSPLPSTITAKLTWNYGAPQSTTFGVGAGYQPGDTFLMAVQLASPVAATGDYPYTIELLGNGGALFDVSFSGQLGVVVNDATGNGVVADPFGAGWGLDGLDRLVPVAAGQGVTAGVLWVFGTGESAFFASDGQGGYKNPPDDFGTLAANGPGYTYTAKDQTRENFDGNGRLTSVVDPHGLAVTYSYDGQGGLTGVATPDGGRATLSYDANHHLQGVQEPGNRTLTFTVDGSGNLTQLTDADGSTRSLGYDAGHRLTSDGWAPFNAAFGYNSATGRLAQVNLGLGSAWSVYPRQPQALVAMVAGAASDVARVTGPLGRTTTYTLDVRQRLVGQRTADGASRTWARDAHEQVFAAADPDQNVTAYAYDYGASGRGDLTQQINADGGTWQYQYDPTFHHVTLKAGPLGATTFTYDPATGDLLSVQDPAGTTAYAYYQSGGHPNGLVSKVTDADGHPTTYAYDAGRRLTSSTDPLNRVTSYAYDSSGNPLTVRDPANHVSTTQYDGRNRLTSGSDGAGDTTTYAYDASGDRTGMTDPRGAVTAYGFDQRDFRTALTEAAGTPLARATAYAYDAAGNATAVTDALNHTTTYAYNLANEPTKATDPLGRTTTTLYDPAGNVTKVLDPLGRPTAFAYDALNRQTQVTDALNQTTTTLYDLAGDRTAVIDPLGHETDYRFDPAGRRTAVRDAVGFLTGTAYDPAGQATAVTDPNNHTTAYAYDPAGQLTKVTDPLGNPTTYAYDLAGNRTLATDADGRATRYGYDAADRQTAVTAAAGTAAAGTTTTLYDRAGNVTGVTDALNHTTTYLYDGLGRQTALTNALSQTATYLYDAADNRTGVTDALNRTTTYFYDQAGQRTQVTDPLSRVATLAYDAADELTGQTDYRGKATAFAYDAAGRRTLVRA